MNKTRPKLVLICFYLFLIILFIVGAYFLFDQMKETRRINILCIEKCTEKEAVICSENNQKPFPVWENNQFYCLQEGGVLIAKLEPECNCRVCGSYSRDFKKKMCRLE